MKIVVTDATFPTLVHERGVAQEFGANIVEAKCTNAAETLVAAEDADVLFVQFASITSDVIARLRPSAIIIRYGIGLDNVDLTAAQARGIKVAYVPDYATGEVADHTVTLLLAASRRIIAYDSSVRDGRWDAVGVGGSLKSSPDTTVGFIGFGRIGREVFARLKPFGFKGIVADPCSDAAAIADLGAEAVDLDTLFERSDMITLHCPLTPETRHIVNGPRLSTMPPGGVVVNTARGGLVDPVALADALDSDHLRAAALDVFEEEPLPFDSPLRAYRNLILTPHAAWYSTSAIDRLQALAADELRRHLTGAPMRCPAAGSAPPRLSRGEPTLLL